MTLTPHAKKRAWQRMAWDAKRAARYWFDHINESVFTQGAGVYNIRLGGIVWSVAHDVDANEDRVLTLNHDRGWNDTGWLGPIRNEKGEFISYGPRVEMAGPRRG